MVSRNFDEMDRVFEQMVEDVRQRFGGRHGDHWWGRPDVAADLHETDDGYALVIDLPGFEHDELDVRAKDGVLFVDASHETNDEHAVRTRRVSERFSVPGDVDVDAVSATYRNGVLELTLPVAGERDAGTRIDVE